MKTKTKNLLVVMTILAYLGMVHYAIITGSQIISFIISFMNPDVAKNYYAVDQQLFKLRPHSVGMFSAAMSLTIIMGALNVYVWIVAIQLMSKLNLMNPFSPYMAKKIGLIAYLLLGVWIIGMLASAYIGWASKHTGEVLNYTNGGSDYLFMAGIVYIIAAIFKRGIELQEENQLTV